MFCAFPKLHINSMFYFKVERKANEMDGTIKKLKNQCEIKLLSNNTFYVVTMRNIFKTVIENRLMKLMS